jgi:hypothetical protein
METPQVAKQMIDFQKTVFNNSFNALVTVQDQTETMVSNFISQLPWVTEDGKKQIKETSAYVKKARDAYKKAVDDGYAQFEKMLNQK